jgi:virginiamycin B lyase
MKSFSSSIGCRSALWPSLLFGFILGGCGDLTEGNVKQPIGALTLMSSSQTTFSPKDSSIQRSSVTGTGSIGTVALASFSVDLDIAVDTVAIAPDGTAWFSNSGRLLRVAADDSVTEVQMPSGENFASSMVSDGVSALWMANWGDKGVGRLDPLTGELQFFSVPSPLSRPTAVTSDGHGGIWLTGGDRPIVGRVDAMNQVFVVASQSAAPPITISTGDVAIASEGRLFISDYDQGRIGRVQGTGYLWTDMGNAAAPSGLAAGDDGAVWFTSLGRPNEVGRVDGEGTLTAYTLPAWPTQLSDKSISAIARAPDGAFWFTLPERSQLGRVDANGNLSFIQLTTPTLPRVLAFDPSGRLWFTTNQGWGRIEF